MAELREGLVHLVRNLRYLIFADLDSFLIFLLDTLSTVFLTLHEMILMAQSIPLNYAHDFLYFPQVYVEE